MASSVVRRSSISNLKKLSPLWACWRLNNQQQFHSEAVVGGGGGGGGGGLPSYMRGAVYWEPNKPLTIEEFHIPRPKTGEVLIKTKGIS